MKNNIDNTINGNIKFVNLNEFKSTIKLLKVLCTNNNVSGNIFNKLFNIDCEINSSTLLKKNKKTEQQNDIILREILSEICPPQLSIINKLFNIDTIPPTIINTPKTKKNIQRKKKVTNQIDTIDADGEDKIIKKRKKLKMSTTTDIISTVPTVNTLNDVPMNDDICEPNGTIQQECEYYEYIDLIFKCVSATVISKVEIQNNKSNYHKIDDWLNNTSLEQGKLPYIFFNTNKQQSPRVTTNDNKKNVLTLKIKNEDLKEDLLTINILLKFKKDDDIEKDNYLLLIKAYVVNDSYDTIRNDPIFKKYFGHIKYLLDGTPYKLYNKIHIRDCVLNSFNGMNSMEYINKAYNAISGCNMLCIQDKSVTRSGELTDSDIKGKNIKPISGLQDKSNKDDIQIENIENIKNDKSHLPWLMTNMDNGLTKCLESSHYIQKFARHCFHTKYLIIIHTSEFNLQSCLFLAVILVRCNNRLCREFLDTLPVSIKQTIMQNAGISSSDESKTDASNSDKLSLSQRVNIWKQLFSLKYGINVKKLVDKCNELCSDDENKNSGSFGDGNAEKERVKKMIGYLEKISINFFLLNIHSQLIELVDNARLIYPTKKINSLQDILISMMSDDSKQDSDLFSGNMSDKVKQYLENFSIFEKTVRERILNMSEGQLIVKKAIWQYIMDTVSNSNPIATRKILCLIGPPGVGKTYIAMCIARILFFEPDKEPTDDEVKNLVYILSIPSLTGENTLLGSNAVYVGAQPGILTKEVLFVQSLFRKLIVLDEIDKPCKYIEQLLSVIDYTQNSKIVDNYFEIEVDMRTVVLIATANDASKINPILKDRMQIINVSGYSTYTKATMVQKQLLKTLLKERGLAENLIIMPLPILEYLIHTRTKEAGVRKLKNLILEIINTVNIAIVTNIGNLASHINDFNDNTYISDSDAFECNFDSNNKYYGYNNNNIEELYTKITNRYMAYLNSISNHNLNAICNIILTKTDIDIIFSDKFKLKNDHIRDIVCWEPGKIIGLYATTMGIGGILPITLKFNKSLAKKGMLITLGAQKTMQDSAMISTILTSDYMSKLDNNIFINYLGVSQSEFNNRIQNVINNSAIHIILDSSISKDGPSAGGAFMISYISKLLGHTLSNRVGLTGEISSNFKITAIGGINMKVNGSIDAGCRAVIAPQQNYSDIIKELVSENSIDVKNEFAKRCAFIYYSDYDQCFILLVRTKPTNTVNNNLSSFDVNIEEGNVSYLTDFNIDVPSIYKIKLSHLSSQSDLINPTYGLNIKLINDITLKDVMNSHFLIIALENIYDIYYFMVMAKHIYNKDSIHSELHHEDSFYNLLNITSDLINIDKPLDVVFDGNKIISDNNNFYPNKKEDSNQNKKDEEDDNHNHTHNNYY